MKKNLFKSKVISVAMASVLGFSIFGQMVVPVMAGGGNESSSSTTTEENLDNLSYEELLERVPIMFGSFLNSQFAAYFVATTAWGAKANWDAIWTKSFDESGCRVNEVIEKFKEDKNTSKVCTIELLKFLKEQTKEMNKMIEDVKVTKVGDKK